MLRPAAVAATCLLTACAAAAVRPGAAYLSERQLIEMVTHPRKWDGKIVTIRMYPYDNGYTESYVVCFHRCDRSGAEKSPFLIYTAAGRFRGSKGDRPVVVTASYTSTCFYRYSFACPEYRPRLFEEIPPGLTR